MLISGQGSLASHRDGPPVRYPLPLDVDTYICDYRSQFDTLRFSALRSHGAAVVAPYRSGFRETAAGS